MNGAPPEAPAELTASRRRRVALFVRGVVQGVGFRPFVRSVALAHDVVGFVRNARAGVEIELEGEDAGVAGFLAAIVKAPAPIHVRSIEQRQLEPTRETSFEIRASATAAAAAAVLPPDLAPCAECLSELFDPRARRYRYPFVSCTRCGPRYSVATELPYDRARTTLAPFVLCASCRAEYDDPRDRRCHAQALACAACGPALELADGEGALLARGEAALTGALERLRRGEVLALLGVGGYQLLVRALDARAVEELRRRKRREERPFAVMFGSLAELERYARLAEAEAALLASPAAPIVLLEPADGARLPRAVGGSSPWLGALLPSSPLHALLLAGLAEPVVCTSGNPSSEPLAIDATDARARLHGVADAFLQHDRRVVRPLDDSVARAGGAGVELLRRARGFAPSPVARLDDPRVVLALGAHQKSTVALLHDGEVSLSQHLGDLGRPGTDALLERTVEELLAFHGVTPELLACDRHPDYASTRFAERLAVRFGVELVRVQHHAAHVAAVCAEHAVRGAVLGFAWDGSGLGSDGTVWGGEALLLDGSAVRRVAHFAPWPLLGGDRAAREPWRSALGALTLAGAAAGPWARAWLEPAELAVALRAFDRGVNVVACGSVGRLFDAVAALAGVRARCSFEGQAALELEALASAAAEAEPYPLPLDAGEPAVAATSVLVRAVLADLARGATPGSVARRFHGALVEHAVEVAARSGASQVALSGGCFQNAWLARELRARLERSGVSVHSAGLVPCNDGGIALGQLALAVATTRARGRTPLG